MKKLLIIFVLVFFTFSFGAVAQVQIATNGYVGINQSSPGYNLDWGGTGRFLTGYGSLIFDNAGWANVATIHPVLDWEGCLGTSTKRFNVIYADNVIARVFTPSDERIKENIKTLDSALDNVMKLRGVSYDLNTNYYKVTDPKLKAKLESERKNEIGFIAQELKEVLPNSVRLDSTNNLYAVNYSEIIPVLVEAMKEQQAQIEELKKLIKK